MKTKKTVNISLDTEKVNYFEKTKKDTGLPISTQINRLLSKVMEEK